MSASINFNPADGENRRIFVGGLDYRTSARTIRAHYEQFGAVLKVDLKTHPGTQSSRGYAFVTFFSMNMAERALEYHPHIIDGEEVSTRRAHPRVNLQAVVLNQSGGEALSGRRRERDGEQGGSRASVDGNWVNTSGWEGSKKNSSDAEERNVCGRRMPQPPMVPGKRNMDIGTCEGETGGRGILMSVPAPQQRQPQTFRPSTWNRQEIRMAAPMRSPQAYLVPPPTVFHPIPPCLAMPPPQLRPPQTVQKCFWCGQQIRTAATRLAAQAYMAASNPHRHIV